MWIETTVSCSQGFDVLRRKLDPRPNEANLSFSEGPFLAA